MKGNSNATLELAALGLTGTGFKLLYQKPVYWKVSLSDAEKYGKRCPLWFSLPVIGIYQLIPNKSACQAFET